MQHTLKLKKSSNVHGARYDPDTETLETDLNDGTWAHFGVSQEDADKFEDADSHGQHFHKFIKNNENYEVKRVK